MCPQWVRTWERSCQWWRWWWCWWRRWWCWWLWLRSPEGPLTTMWSNFLCWGCTGRWKRNSRNFKAHRNYNDFLFQEDHWLLYNIIYLLTNKLFRCSLFNGNAVHWEWENKMMSQKLERLQFVISRNWTFWGGNKNLCSLSSYLSSKSVVPFRLRPSSTSVLLDSLEQISYQLKFWGDTDNVGSLFFSLQLVYTVHRKILQPLSAVIVSII